MGEGRVLRLRWPFWQQFCHEQHGPSAQDALPIHRFQGDKAQFLTTETTKLVTRSNRDIWRGQSELDETDDGRVAQVKQGFGPKRIEAAANGEIEVIETAKVAIGSDMACELPPDFFDGIEAVADVGGQIHHVEA